MQTRNGSEFPPYEKIYSKPTVNIIHTNESKFPPSHYQGTKASMLACHTGVLLV